MENNGVIKAYPTKRFFLDMLTRDISIERAIIDLIDNSIDGAKRLRPNGNYEGLWIKLDLDENQLSIKDNCGGIPLNIAKEYAFCFGRSEDYDKIVATEMKQGVGRFGVGMKRALFKVGQVFQVESKNKADYFEIKQDIFLWLRKDEWEFEFNSLGNTDTKEDGTSITVSKLFPNIGNYFKKTNSPFFNALTKDIGITIGRTLDKGLKVFVNGVPIESKTVEFITVDNYRPIKKEGKYGNVKVTVFAGIGQGNPDLAGWYVYMNDRLVLANDKSYVTGWKDKDNNDPEFKKFTSKHATFRGVAYFEADNSEDLPMTTTKTGVDANHPVYIAARAGLINPAKDEVSTLIDQFKTVGKITELGEVNNPTYKLVKAEELRINHTMYSEKLVLPNRAEAEESKFIRIAFSKEIDVVEKVKQIFKTKNANIAGEKAFDTYVKNNEL